MFVSNGIFMMEVLAFWDDNTPGFRRILINGGPRRRARRDEEGGLESVNAIFARRSCMIFLVRHLSFRLEL